MSVHYRCDRCGECMDRPWGLLCDHHERGGHDGTDWVDYEVCQGCYEKAKAS